MREICSLEDRTKNQTVSSGSSEMANSTVNESLHYTVRTGSPKCAVKELEVSYNHGGLGGQTGTD